MLRVLAPCPSFTPHRGANDNSIVISIAYGARHFLFTGDAEHEEEMELLQTHAADLRADYLKVGHHGSNTSSTGPFLDAVSPIYAVISDGFENSFHHPHPLVLERLTAHHVGILRTDLQGLITIRTNGQRISVETYLPR